MKSVSGSYGFSSVRSVEADVDCKDCKDDCEMETYVSRWLKRQTFFLSTTNRKARPRCDKSL